MKKILLICLGIALGSNAFAGQTCKYQDAEGHIIYANVPIKGAKKLMCFGSEGAPAPESSKGSKESRSAAPTPADFPRVDADTQRQRDDTRRKVLEDELAAERKLLDQAKKDYAEGEMKPEVFKTTVTETVCETKTMNGKNVQVCKDVPKEITRRNVAKYEEKMQKLQENVALHEKNIQMLEKELSSVK